MLISRVAVGLMRMISSPVMRARAPDAGGRIVAFTRNDSSPSSKIVSWSVGTTTVTVCTVDPVARPFASAGAASTATPRITSWGDAQESSRRALESGVTLAWILDTVQRVECESPIVLMSYLNPVIAMGLQRFADRCAEVDVAGLIVPDLPLEECAPIMAALDDVGVALVQLVTPVTPADRLAKLCELSRGFVYAVTVTGTTGGEVGQKQVMFDYLDRVRGLSAVPVLAGFGIRNAAQVSAVAPHADGVIVGSALIEVLQRGEDPIAFLSGLRESGKVEAET